MASQYPPTTPPQTSRASKRLRFTESLDEPSSPLSSPPPAPLTPPPGFETNKQTRSLPIKFTPTPRGYICSRVSGFPNTPPSFESRSQSLSPTFTPTPTGFTCSHISNLPNTPPDDHPVDASYSVPEPVISSPLLTSKRPKKAAPESLLSSKPEPISLPKIWAHKRQQLCTTLPWYDAYQSGAYTYQGKAFGFLCDKEVGVRDKFDDEIIISRAYVFTHSKRLIN
jgi:hypothetical protein